MKALYKNSIQNLVTIVKGACKLESSAEIESISSDSRNIDEGTLFIPLVGERFDGHDFLEGLCKEKKIRAYLTERELLEGEVPGIRVENTLYALGAIAKEYRSTFDLPLIGVTGTNGKTTTKELIACGLSARYTVHKNSKNFNNEIGVPFTLFELRHSHQAAVIEMGMNHSGEISRLTNIVAPDCALITNADAGHLEFLGSIEGVAKAKSEIFESMKEGSLAYINCDSKCFDIMRDAAIAKNLKVRSYGLSAKADFSPESYQLFEDAVEICYQGYSYKAPLYGKHNVLNLFAAVLLALEFGVDPLKLADSLANFANTGMRSEVLKGKCTVINDAYNSNPLSLKSALVSASEIFSNKRKIAVLGDMKELGSSSKKFHAQAGEDVVASGFEFLFCYGDDSRYTVEEACKHGMDKKNAILFADRSELIESLSHIITHEDLVLVKGSRSMKMEEVADSLVC